MGYATFNVVNQLMKMKFSDIKISVILKNLSSIEGFSEDNTMVSTAWVANQIQQAQYKGSVHPFGEDAGILYAYDAESDVMWIKKVG